MQVTEEVYITFKSFPSPFLYTSKYMVY